MPRNCFVPGCKTTQKCKRDVKPGEKRVTLFRAPKDPILRKRWHIASRRGDREMTERDVMCELHFTEDCIDRHFTTLLYDNVEFKLEREKSRLKKGSIPTIFPFSDVNSSSKRGRPKKSGTVRKKENGSWDFVSGKKLSPSKFSRQVKVLACMAYGCTNSSDTNIHGISFHRFPMNKARRKVWISAVGKKDWQPSKDSVLCSAHFPPEQIEQTRSSVRLKPGTVPTILSLGEQQQINRLPENIQAEFYDLSDSSRLEIYSTENSDISDQDSDEDDRPDQDSDEDDRPDQDSDDDNDVEFSVQEENDEISAETPSPYRNTPSKNFMCENLIAEGYEEVFGKFVANELKILSCDPSLYLRTKEKIWQILEYAGQIRIQ